LGVLPGETSTAVDEPETGADASLPVPDGELLEQLYRAHAKPVFKFLLRLTFGDRREAEDLLQETLFRAWRQIREQSLDVDRVLPWLYTVARRLFVDAVRARRARPLEVSGTEVATLLSPDDRIERMLLVQTVRRGLRTLSAEHRHVLVEVFYNDRSARETAEVLGIPEGTVKSRTFYALRALGATTAVAGLER
jgi:RNA polymerase sigma-70 factor, ECF subfamily